MIANYVTSLINRDSLVQKLYTDLRQGKIPAIGHETKIPPYTFKVESVDMRRIKRFKVIIDAS